MPSTTAILETFLSLAPAELPNHRKHRFQGDGLSVELSGLAVRDRTLVSRFYQILTELLYAITGDTTSDAQKWSALEEWAKRHDMDRFIDEVRELGTASHAEHPSEALAKTMHDLRGGALSSLLGRLQLLDHLPRQAGQLKAIFVQTRDHLKIMRNAVTGLDDPRREADRRPKVHAMQLMLDKWHESVVGPKWRERPIRMEIDCHYAGALTECCLESAAIDRIFYNLSNNACRYAADERLAMVVFPVAAGTCLRFVLSNEVSDADAATLRALTDGPGEAERVDRGNGRSLLALFEPRVSSTGSGFGLTVVADFVAGAFGLRDRHEALRERYVGAILDGRTFRVWFHWPIAQDHLPQKLDDYRRSEESLSEV